MHLLGPAIMDYTVNGRIQMRMGNANAEYAPSGVYPQVWRALCQAAVTGWSEDARFATAPARLEHREELDAAIAVWTAGFEPAALEELLQSVGVPAHRLSNAPDVLADPQLKAREHIVFLDHPQFGSVPYESSRMRFSRTPAVLRWPGPKIGEHNDYVLRELLGLNDSEIAKLVSSKALE